MRRLLIAVLAVILLAVAWLAVFPVGQHADRSFDASVAHPAYTTRHPVVLFDQAHYNAHSLGGGFAPFAKLLRSDGYELRKGSERFTPGSLAGVDVLVIVNAAGGSNPKLFGINLVPLRKGSREAPAFTADEIETVRRWVDGGGSLLLVADHYPFGSAASSLGSAFGVTMHAGSAEAREYADPRDPGSIAFTRANSLLPDSPIANGRGPSERIERVLTFTGQSFDAPKATPLLALPPTAIEFVPPPPVFKKQPAGPLQGAALPFGRGRVVILGEAAMLTAQVNEGRRFGMNMSGIDNRQFALNVMHWLSRLL
jgi:hypothetical protein